MGDATGQSGRAKVVEAANEGDGRILGVGGATDGIPPVGGATGVAPPIGGVPSGSGWAQATAGPNGESGQVLGVGGATAGTRPMGGGGGPSGRAEAPAGANQSGVKERDVNEAALWAELEAELRRSPAGSAPSALWALVALPAAPDRKCRHVDGAALLRGGGTGVSAN